MMVSDERTTQLNKISSTRSFSCLMGYRPMEYPVELLKSPQRAALFAGGWGGGGSRPI